MVLLQQPKPNRGRQGLAQRRRERLRQGLAQVLVRGQAVRQMADRRRRGAWVLPFVDVDGLKLQHTIDLQVPGLTVLGVHDVAANGDGSVVAAALRAQTSQGQLVSAIARIDAQTVSVRHQTPERNYTELALPGGPGGPLYALAPGDGLFRMTLSSGNLQRLADGNYVSNLRINPQGSLGWVVRAQTGDGGTTYVVENFSLGSRRNVLLTVPLAGNFVPSDLAVVAKAAGVFCASAAPRSAGSRCRGCSRETRRARSTPS